MIDRNEAGFPTANGHASLKERVQELQLTNRLDGTKAAKSASSTAWLPWTLCILLALAWGGMGLRLYRNTGGNSNPAPTTIEGNAASTQTARPVQVRGASDGEILLESKGYLIPSQSIPISPIDVAGRVIELNIEEGKAFREGEILARIDPTRFNADVLEAVAQVAAAEARYFESRDSWLYEKKQADAELSEARAQCSSAELEYKTAKATRGEAVSKLDLNMYDLKWKAADQHVTVLVVKRELTFGKPREQRIEAALRELKAAEARLQRAQWSVDNCTIKAPVTGIILTKKAELHSLINPVVGGVSTSLCEIADLRKIEVDLEIQERDIAKIRFDITCKIRPDAYPDRVYDGYVDRIMPIANRARGIIPVRVKVIIPPNEKQGSYLKPEMAVAVTFINTPSTVAPKRESEAAPKAEAPPELPKIEGKQ